jgi:REP element-mobilizing transposase RayT
MNHPVRKRLPHAVPDWVPSDSYYFITINCDPRGKNHLCRVGIGDALLASATHYNQENIWRCRLLLLMPDHVHAIINFSMTRGLRRTIENWKRYFVLRNAAQAEEKVRYIEMNPVRRGFCERAEDWRWVFRAHNW